MWTGIIDAKIWFARKRSAYETRKGQANSSLVSHSAVCCSDFVCRDSYRYRVFFERSVNIRAARECHAFNGVAEGVACCRKDIPNAPNHVTTEMSVTSSALSKVEWVYVETNNSRRFAALDHLLERKIQENSSTQTSRNRGGALI